MTISQQQRPKFFEGQFLGAEDLTAVVEYGRLQSARHALGAHVWGIAIGLDIREKPSPSGTLSAFVQPGLAYDGFGRAIVVPKQTPIPPDLFKSITFDPAIDGTSTPGRVVEVWIRYVEKPAALPRAGFEQCENDDQFGRFEEGFRIEVGARPVHIDRHDEIVIAGRSMDAAEALDKFDPTTPPTFIYDESIPYQTFPDTGAVARWYVPLGIVRWLPNSNVLLPGQFVARAAADLVQSAAVRRPCGVVAGEIAAVDRTIRLRDRRIDYIDRSPNDVASVEGQLRVLGDAKLWNGKLDFRNAQGLSGPTLPDGSEDPARAVPLRLQRAESNGRGGTDLQVVIGKGTTGKNAFAVGALDNSNVLIEKVVVQDDGKVGIGTTSPALTLDVRGDFGRDDAAATLHLFGSRIGDVGGGVLFVRSGGGVVAFDGNDLVGVGTASPTAGLHVAGDVALEQQSSGAPRVLPAGATLFWNDGTWLRLNQNRDFTRPVFGVHTPGLFAPVSLNVGGAGGWGDPGGGNVWITGNVGIGTTTVPGRLTLQGTVQPAQGSLSFFTADADIRYDGGSDQIFVFRDTGGKTAFLGGQIGIGTTATSCRLHVVDTLDADAGLVQSHVALIDNASLGNSADVLALRVGSGNPSGDNNFITFFGGNNPVGRIEGNGANGIALISGGADFAECLPRLDDEQEMEAGDIVGIFEGRVSRKTDGANQVMAVTERPIVVGNSPAGAERGRSVQVAFVGQVGVKVRGTVRAGDFIVASGLGDGTGVAVAPDALTFADASQVIGRAWQSSDDAGIKRINTAVGTQATLFSAR